MTAPPAPIHALLIRDDTIESGSLYDQPIITTTVRTSDARHILCTCYTAVTGSSPAIRTDSQQTARLWVGNFRVRIPADIVGLVTHWLAANVPAANPAPRPIPACAAEAAKAIGVAA